jgi:ubiquinone/menaquinone biosynthesis C-methylase UbiE
MNLFQKFNAFFLKRNVGLKIKNADAAYDLWASSYDAQPDNLMLAWDEEIFSSLLNDVNLQNKIIADIGCGTGRHWQKIFNLYPKKLIGFDVSEGMLKMLKQKFPNADIHVLKDDYLHELHSNSCDFIFSTLTIAHIEDAEKTLEEWKRVLKPGGEMIITDYHPAVLEKGGKRTFNYKGETVEIKNYVHSIGKIKNITRQLGLQVIRFVEKSIDESAKPYYEKQHATAVYETWKGMPIIYGIHLKKPDVVK